MGPVCLSWTSRETFARGTFARTLCGTFGLGVLTIGAACVDVYDGSQEQLVEATPTMTLTTALIFPSLQAIDTVQVECTCPTPPFFRRRSVDVRGAASPRVEVYFGQVPDCLRSTCSMNALSVSGDLLCRGRSRPFEVRGGRTSLVEIPVQCSSRVHCGDGFVDAGEECDLGPGNGPGSGCTLANDPRGGCRVVICGDGHVDAAESYPEQCDDGNRHSDDGCDPQCQLETCGDGIPQAGRCIGLTASSTVPRPCTTDEDCSDIRGAICGEECDYAAGLYAPEICTSPGDPRGSCRFMRCGDGVVDPARLGIDGEACDDGNREGGDGCSPDCRLE